MSIEKKSIEILSLCEKLDKLRRNQRNANDFNSIESELKVFVERIEPISKTVIALANELKNNVTNPIPNVPKEGASLLDAALKSAVDNELELVKIDLQKFRLVFNTLREQLKTRADTDWSTLTKQHAPWSEDLLRGLEEIGFSTQLDSLKRCAQNIAKTTTNLPQDKDDIETFLRGVKEYQVATEQIDLPPFMKKFLQNATRGVRLDSLTPDVQKWLQENQLLNKFAIWFA